MFRKLILSSLIAVGMSSCTVAALVAAPVLSASMAMAPAAVAAAR
jgi:hypothetical protein